MFKQHFIDLVNVNRDIGLERLVSGKSKQRLNTMTVLMYHLMFGTGKYEAGTLERKRV